jgi:hypothetical protein
MELALTLEAMPFIQPRAVSFPASLMAGALGGIWVLDQGRVWADTAGTTPITDGVAIARVDDISGNGNHLLQATAAARPTWNANGGLPYALFDGTDDRLTVAIAFASAVFDRISAFRQITWTANDRLFGNGPTGVASGILYQNGVTPEIRQYDGANGAVNAGLVLGADGVVTERHNNASSRLAVNNAAYASAATGTDAVTGISVGADPGGTNASNVRWYGAFMRAGATLTDPEITSLREYFAAKAGVTL